MKNLILFLFPLSLMAQSSLAEKLSVNGSRCYHEAKYDSAIYYYDTYLEQFGNQDINESCPILNNMSDIYNRIGRGEKSRVLAKRVLKECRDNIEEVATAYINLSNTIAIYDSDFDSALLIINKGIELLLSSDNKGKVLAQAYRSQGVTYYDLVQYQKAADSYINSLRILEEIGLKEGKQYAITLNNLANAYDGLGIYYKGLETHFLALKIKRNIYPKVHPEIATSLNNIGNSYHYLEQYEKSLEYFNLALDQRIELFGKTHHRIASVMNNIGNLHYDRGEYEKSKLIHWKALNIRKKVFRANHSILLYSYTNLARAFIALENIDSALFYSNLAIENHNLNYDSPTDLLAMIYQNHALYISQSKNLDSAEFCLTQASDYLSKNYGIKHPKIASVMNSLGELYTKQHDYSKALIFYQKGLISAVEDFNSDSINSNPTSDLVSDPGELIKLLKGKAHALYSIYINTQESEKLIIQNQLLSTLSSADKYVESFRKNLFDRSDLQNLGEQSVFIYKMLVDINYRQYVESSNENFLEKAWVAIEKGKSNLLIKRLNENQARVGAVIPDSLLAIEKDLLRKINEFKSNDDSENLFDSKRKYEDLLSSYEKQFPQYYRLKYQYKFKTINDIKNGLKRNEVLIEYQLFDSLLYLIQIDNRKTHIYQSPLPNDFSEMIDCYKNYLTNPLESMGDSTKKAVTGLSNLLIEKVNLENEQIDHLIIVPDGIIGSIPMGMLTHSDIDSHLFKNYSIQYAYSAKTLLNEKELNSSKYQADFGGFAPTYEAYQTEENFSGLSELRNNIKPLRWNQAEVTSISEKFDGDKFLGDDASESVFQKMKNKYKILHLATHTFLDQKIPQNSKLIFNPTIDSLQDGFLHAFEIYNLRIKAQLAVLSACSSGSGKYSNGEGVMSLAHAFRYAGASSVVMSHWPVDDKSTYEIMYSFYENLSAGQTKSQALRNAKIQFLETAEPERQHPFYWSSFVLVGKNDPIYSTYRNHSLIIKILSLIAILFIVIFVINKRNKHKF